MNMDNMLNNAINNAKNEIINKDNSSSSSSYSSNTDYDNLVFKAMDVAFLELNTKSPVQKEQEMNQIEQDRIKEIAQTDDDEEENVHSNSVSDYWTKPKDLSNIDGSFTGDNEEVINPNLKTLKNITSSTQTPISVLPTKDMFKDIITMVGMDKIEPSEVLEPDITTNIDSDLNNLNNKSDEEISSLIEKSDSDYENYNKSIDADLHEIPQNYGNPIDNSIIPNASEILEQMKDDNTKNNITLVNRIDSLTGAITASQEMITKAFNAISSYANRKQDDKYAEAVFKADERPKIEDYGINTTIINNEPVSYTVLGRNMSTHDREKLLKSFINGNRENNFDVLRIYITGELLKYFGDNRINSICACSSYEIVINNTCLCPQIALTTEEIYEYLPIDVKDKIEQRLYAEFFLWGMIKQFPNLNTLVFEDLTLMNNVVMADLGISRNYGLSSLFKMLPSLEVLVLGGETITRDSLTSEESVPVKEKIASHKRITRLKNGIRKIKLMQAVDGITTPLHLTGKLEEAMGGSLDNYFHNRGDKGIIHFSAGCLARGILYGGSWGLNTTSRFIYNVGSMIRNAFTDGTTPINEEDLQG